MRSSRRVERRDDEKLAVRGPPETQLDDRNRVGEMLGRDPGAGGVCVRTSALCWPDHEALCREDDSGPRFARTEDDGRRIDCELREVKQSLGRDEGGRGASIMPQSTRPSWCHRQDLLCGCVVSVSLAVGLSPSEPSAVLLVCWGWLLPQRVWRAPWYVLEIEQHARHPLSFVTKRRRMTSDV